MADIDFGSLVPDNRQELPPGEPGGFDFGSALKLEQQPGGFAFDFASASLFEAEQEDLRELPPGESVRQEGVEVDPVQAVFDQLVELEGEEGDTTGAAVTGRIGVTQAARDAVGAKDLSDEEVARAFLGKLDAIFTAEIDGYAGAPVEVREVLLDAGYNIGEDVARFRGVKRAMAEQDWLGVGLNLLDTASISKQASRGLARRRALLYNKLAPEGGKITAIEQKEDGTLIYKAGEKKVFEYRPSGGRHRTSAVGILRV
jgi:hypothetical protein